MNAAAKTIAGRGELLHDEPMAKHTSWRVGGPADQLYRPAALEDLAGFLAALAPDTPLVWIGYGSNLLVRDAGIRGVVISTTALPKVLERVDAEHVRVSAGVSCARLARQCAKWKLGPATFFAGIPGTIGGALAMNAGAFGGETWTHVETVETIDRAGTVRVRPRSDFAIAYRNVRGGAGEWFIAVTFRFEHDEAANTGAIKSLLSKRNEAQPLGLPSCGSVFRNPPNDYAGRLIDAAGLKGERVGGAFISDKHANFIINDGTATAHDIETLIERVKLEVERQTGVVLETEVRIVGEPRGSEAHA